MVSIGREMPHPANDDDAGGDADEMFLLTAELIVPESAKAVEEAKMPPSLAYATAPLVRPWRGLAIAGAVHVVAVAVVLLLIKMHLPAPPPDEPVISVVVETTPPGNTKLAVTQTQAAPPLPAPPQPTPQVQPVTPPKVELPLPPPPLVTRPADMPLPMPPAPPPPPAPPRVVTLPPALVRGTDVPKHNVGNMVVGANRPAQPDMGSTVYYSELSRTLGEEGEVKLSVQVLANGSPGRITVMESSRYTRLDRDAQDSVMTWHFQPALKNGKPVDSVLSYWVRFQLQ